MGHAMAPVSGRASQPMTRPRRQRPSCPSSPPARLRSGDKVETPAAADSARPPTASDLQLVFQVAILEGELTLDPLAPARLVVKVHVGALLVLVRGDLVRV